MYWDQSLYKGEDFPELHKGRGLLHAGAQCLHRLYNINHINDYIGDQYIKSKKNNDTVYYSDSIQITLNKKNKVKKVELFTDHYKVEGNFYIGLEKNNLDYENHKEANNQYIAYSENKTVKMTYTLSNNTITKITLA